LKHTRRTRPHWQTALKPRSDLARRKIRRYTAMKRFFILTFFMGAALLAARFATAQPTPIVNMIVTLPDGKTQNVSVRESGTRTVKLADGTEVGVRPTILDSKPGTHLVVTLFRMPTTSHEIEEMGSVDVKTGGSAVASKTSPALKIAVTSVSENAETR